MCMQLARSRLMPQYWALDDAEVEAHISYVTIALDNGALPDELIPAYWQGRAACDCLQGLV